MRTEAQLDVARCPVGPGGRDPGEAARGRVQVATIVQHAALEVEVRRGLPAKGDRLRCASPGVLEVAGLVLGHALQVPHRGEARLAAQDLLVEGDRALQVAAPVQGARLLDSCGRLRLAHRRSAARACGASATPRPGSHRWASSTTP
jgi:hypothetical protein